MSSDLGPEIKKAKHEKAPYMEGTLLCMGNPLLDISADVDAEFLEKYGLKPNDAILADEKHKNMYDEMCEKFKVEFVPGGATQNSARVAQWLLGVRESVTFFGCVGKDKYGKVLEDKAREAGVKVKYQYHDTAPTGTCAVMVSNNGSERSLCAYLAAANEFTIEHIQKPENKELIEKAKFYYIGGFPLTVCPPAMEAIAKHSADNGKVFCMNLSAPFLCQFFKEPMMKIMPYVDILFGNETEAATFAEEHNFGTTDVKEIVVKMASLPKQNGNRGRVVVITQGAEPTIIYKEGKVVEHAIIPIKPEEIVDCNGAGDAFVGGFLAQLVAGRDVDECVRCGNYAANVIIRRPGCTLPDMPTFQQITSM